MSDYDRNVSARWGTAARTRTAEIDQGLRAYMPPDETTSVAPAFNWLPLAVPDTNRTLLLTVVALATPPDATDIQLPPSSDVLTTRPASTSPAPLTTVPLAVPPVETLSVLPAETVA